MKITQKHLSNKSTFEFGDESLIFTGSDRSGKQSFSVEYDDISFDTKELEERSPRFRFVGLVWMLIGGLHIYYRYAESGVLRGSIWLTLGVVCLIAYYFARTKYTILPANAGNLFVIRDKKHDMIMAEIHKRRREQILERYGDIDFTNDPNKEIDRFKWLARQEVITEEELQEKIDTITSKRRLGLERVPNPRLN